MLSLKHSIITRIAGAFLVSALIPAVVALTLFERESSRQTIEQLEDHLSSQIRGRAELLEEHIDSLQVHAASLARSRVLREYLSGLEAGSSDTDDFGALAEDLVHVTQEELWGGTHHIFIASAAGQIILSPPRGEYAVPARAPLVEGGAWTELDTHLGSSLRSEPFFQKALSSPTVTSFSGFEERDHYHQLIVQPVVDDGGTALGLVVIEVAIDGIQELLASGFELGTSGRIFLVDEQGAPVVHEKGLIETADITEGMARCLAGEGPQFGVFDREGKGSWIGMYCRSGHYPWAIGIEMARSEVLEASQSHQAFVLKVLALVATVLGIVGLIFGFRFGGPLRRLAAAASRVGQGDLQHSIPVTHGDDEIGSLERATESMRKRLLEHIQTLDQKVEGHTSELQEALRDAQLSEERYELAVRGSLDGLWDWDLQTNRVYYATCWKELLGFDDEDIGPAPDEWLMRISPEDRAEFNSKLERHKQGGLDRFDMEMRMLHASGEERWMLCRAAAIRDGEGATVRLAGSLADITDLKRAQENLHELAHHDSLTGLANRQLLVEHLREAMDHARREEGREFAVLFFDFDRFKVINDSLGHRAGDELLVNIAHRLRANIRGGDTAARFGGDEFVVLLDGVYGLVEAEEVCTRLLEVMSEPHILCGQEVVSTASVGVVSSKLGYERAEDIIRDADAAMYQAKAAGKAQYRIFDQEMHAQAIERLRMENDLRHAQARGEFELYYQPIVDMVADEIAGFEALIRWVHPERGFVSPEVFIPVTEETGSIVELGEWVLRESCRQMVYWRERLGTERRIFVNVNLSRRQLVHPSLLATLEAVNAEYDIHPGDIKLEITETTVVDDRHDMVPVMETIRQLGFPLAMDDFGTGYSSLSCLHQFPIDVLKIDRSFICNIEDSREFTAVVQAIMTLAHHLELKVVAEGIETPEQLAQLQVMDCEYAQGYLFSRPVDADAATELLFAETKQRRSA